MEQEDRQRLMRIERLLMGQKAVLNLDEASELIGMSRTYIYKLTSSGKIPFFKPNGKQIYFDRLELESWLKRNRSKTDIEAEEEALRYTTLNPGGL
jgi:excisionase family DNA binding protein